MATDTISQPPRSPSWGRLLSEVAREIDRHPLTLLRWRDPGLLDAAGTRRRLAMHRVGGRWHVTDEALADFFESLKGEGSSPEPAPADA